jgi:Protein of unknown function (DUF3570)
VRATVLVLATFVLCSCGEAQKVAVQSAAGAVYVRSDTDATTIWAPRARARVRFGDSVFVDGVYMLDSWTSASIDIVTAATDAVHEVRQEANAGATIELSPVTISGSYRYSTENDYWSHGGVGTLSVDMFEKNTTLALSGFGSSDTVGRAGWPTFRRPQNSVGGRLSLSQVLGRNAIGQVSWETTHIGGYQASPYRFVAIGGQGTCAGSGELCVPESHPDERLRHALGLSERTALGRHASLGLLYRFYFDDWEIMSHTIEPDLSFLLAERSTLALTHRFYTQDSAYFYLPRYVGEASDLGYVTRDRKLSTAYNNQIGLRFEQGFALGESGSTVLALGARVSLTRIVYQAFVGLERVDVLEATLSLGLDWL